jgi:hypothetical protein
MELRYKDLLVEAEAELMEEKKKMAKEEIKGRLREIDKAEKVLGRMKKQLNFLLEEAIE